MKELSIEEKAKAYDEAKARMSRAFNSNRCTIGFMNEIFPELKESEDERIRKDIITYLEQSANSTTLKINAQKFNKWISWLEKQGEQKPTIEMKTPEESLGIDSDTYNKIVDECIYGEQKPADKAEPKFKVGDWIANDYCVGKVIALTNDAYLLDTEQGIPFSCEHNAHLWTIQDAKDGDVIVCPKYAGDIIPNIFIFKNIEIKDNNVICHCSFSKAFRTEGYIANVDSTNTDFYPATKEQREQLEKAMADAGFTFDFEKKELKKIEDEEYDGEDYGIDGLWHAKNILEKTLGEVDGYQTDDGILEHKCAISAVDRLYKQKPAWSEEDEYRADAIAEIKDESQKELAETYLTVFDKKFPILPTLRGKQLADYKNFLNKCQQIFGLKYWGIRPLQAKLFEKLSLLWAAWGAEHLQGLGQTDGDRDNEISMWSEEDEMIALSIEQVMNCASLLNIVPEKIDKIKTWLKSLKERHIWKPSEEQMDALRYVCRNLNPPLSDNLGRNSLKTLELMCQELKKLK